MSGMEVRDGRRFAFFIIDNELVDKYLPVIGPNAFAVYSALVRIAGENARCVIRIRRLAEMCKIGESTVKRALDVMTGDDDARTLQNAGLAPLISSAERYAEGTRNRLANQYTLLSVKQPEVGSQRTEVGSQRTEVGSERTQGGFTVNQHTKTTRTKTENTKTKRAADAAQERASNDDDVIMARFERWYAVYPKKRSKQAAIKAWKKIRPSEQLTEQMIAATEAWKRSEDWTKQHGKFIPYPASWLNAGGWEDQLPDEQQHEQQREQQQRALDDFDPIAFLEREHNGLDDEQLARVNAGAPLESVLTDFQKQHLHEGRMRHAMRREMMRRSQDYV